MPADSLNYQYLANELNFLLKDGRIDKITMPSKDKIVLLIRANSKNYSLLLSCEPSAPRCHITNEVFENPLTAPSFLMHLRKHIGGGKIDKVILTPFERIINFHLTCSSELALKEQKILSIEIMGKYSNIILINQNGTISESMRHISADISSKRIVLPGFKYLSAPSQNKIDCGSVPALIAVLENLKGENLAGFILDNISGLSKTSISEVIHRTFDGEFRGAYDEEKRALLANNLNSIYEEKNISPCVYFLDNKPVDFSFCEYKSINCSKVESFETLSLAMEFFYTNSFSYLQGSEREKQLNAVIKTALQKVEKRLLQAKEKLEESKDLEIDKLYGELIISNIYKISKGQKSLLAENYYSENCEQITIPLDDKLSPQQNAQKYYKRYNKKKKTIENANLQTEKFLVEKEYLESVLASLQTCDVKEDFLQVKDELEKSGYIKLKQGATAKKTKPSVSAYIKTNFEGYNIYCGKNNMQNESLTKNAKNSDIWLHTKNIHGSHVIIENNSKDFPPASVIEFAASLAAYNSKARESDKVPVDYTFAKNVSKPNNAAIGKVIYVNYYTLYVTPHSNAIKNQNKK